MDETDLWAAVVAAELELRIARGELAEAEIEPSSNFGALDEIRTRVAVAAVALTRAQHRWRERSSGSPPSNDNQLLASSTDCSRAFRAPGPPVFLRSRAPSS